MTDINNITTQRAIQGLTLIEVMIALVILSVGLLGLAGLQIQGLRGTSGSNSRVQAVFIISDMAERMHANTTEVNTNLRYAANVTIDASACGAAPTNCNGSGSNCSTTALAVFDDFEVCQAMAANLPFGATLNVTCVVNLPTNPCTTGSNSIHTLALSWNEMRDSSLGAVPAQTVTLVMLP